MELTAEDDVTGGRPEPLVVALYQDVPSQLEGGVEGDTDTVHLTKHRATIGEKRKK